MKKIINSTDSFVQDTMEGIIYAYDDKVKLLNDDFRVLLSNYPAKEGKVGIVTAGGSGHLPVFLGYVGNGMLDGCTVGDVFASPASEKMADMIRACDRGNGVLCLYGNYNGDRFNFSMACEEVEFDDIETASVLIRDDVASSPKENADRRRGVAGMVYAFKIAGAAADRMMSLKEVVAVTEKALGNIRSMGVALSPCIVPKAGKPTFSIADDEIEVGMGIHGEAGIEVKKMMTADEVAETLVTAILIAESKTGEKTIIDSLYPGAQALVKYADNPAEAVREAAKAAAEGSEATKQMRAVHGRAAYSAERSIGILDGGSVVGKLVFQGIADYYSNK